MTEDQWNALGRKASERPPLGLKPEFAHEADSNHLRVQHILSAIERYSKDGRDVPEEWFEELRRRSGRKQLQEWDRG